MALQWTRCAVIAALHSILAFPLAAQSRPGALAGRVLDYADVPVTGATVTATPVTPGRIGAQIRAISGDNGAFELSPAPPGAYMVCAEFAGRQLLDPCAWGERTLHINVGPGQRVAAGVKLLKGAPVNVRIDGPSQLFSAGESASTGANLIVGVHAPNGLFHSLRPAGTDPRGGATSPCWPRPVRRCACR